MIGWKYRNIILATWSLFGCVFTFRNENQRSLQALFIIKGINSMCVSPPWPTFRWWYLRKGLEDKRDHTTGPTDISFSFNNPSLLSPILFYLSVRAWHELYMPAHGFHFPFPLSPLSTSMLPHFLSFSPVLFVSPVSPCYPCFFLLLCCLHFSLYVPFHRLFSCCLCLIMPSKLSNKIQ